MRVLFAPIIAVMLLMGSVMPVIAITPEEQLSDPILEQRARGLSAQLRCLVCQNQSIDDSDADLAVDLRREVRGQLLSGLDDDAILANLQRTYGDYILLKPPVSVSTYALWAAPFVMLLLAGILFWQSRRPSEMGNVSERLSTLELTEESAPSPAEIEPFGLSARTVGIVVAGIALLTGVLYLQLGSPALEAQPIEARQAERIAAQSQDQAEQNALQENLAKAKQEAAERPNSVEAQMSLALAFARLDDFQNEVAALRRALVLANEAPVIKAMLAEALSRQADGQITLPARALISEVLALVPNEPRALFMAGLAVYQDESYEAAVEIWGQLERVAPPDSPWPALARRNIISAAEKGGITLEDFDEGVVADIVSASQEDRQEMIAAMVEGLEERLLDAPDDEEGWQRLIQARRVLADEAGLLRALDGAATAFPSSRDAQLAVLEFVLSQSDIAYLEKGRAALGRLGAIDNQALDYLFFAGHIARLSGDDRDALLHWQALYERLETDDSGFKDQLAKQISELKSQ